MNLKKLISWSQNEFSDLPWRKNRNLYRTLVSEIMLQQTTVGTVKNHFEKFLQRFKTLEDLAMASEEELLIAWKGLGYYRRARNLKKIAEYLLRNVKGEFPKTTQELQSIPGIGPYTSQAIVAIGRDERGLAVDANLERVISRLYGLKEEKGLKLQKKIYELFNSNNILNIGSLSYRALNEALMDLGRTYCQARKTSCELCPLNKDCVAYQEGMPLKYPIGKNIIKKPSIEHEIHLLRLIIIKNDKILVYKKSEKEWLSGQYEVPTLIISSTDKKLNQYPRLKSEIEFSGKNFKSGITKYTISNLVVKIQQKNLEKLGFHLKTEWRELDENANLSTASYKAIKLFMGSIL
jgi:A/G-specific adenine glycosylase